MMLESNINYDKENDSIFSMRITLIDDELSVNLDNDASSNFWISWMKGDIPEFMNHSAV